MARLFLFFALLLMCATGAQAQDRGFVPKGTWVVSGYGSYSGAFIGEKAQIGAATFGLGYYFLDNLSINAEASGYYDHQNAFDSQIAAIDLLLRNHLLHRGRFSLFVDLGGGLSYADRRTPYYGTYFNFLIETGVGATFSIQDNLDLIGGVRYLHFSNAALEGPLHNPSINAGQVYLGLMMRF